MKGAFTSSYEKIDGYEAAFRTLKEALDTKSLVQVTIFTSRMSTRVDAICEYRGPLGHSPLGAGSLLIPCAA